MRIEKLECENFISHRSTTLQFQQGINVIVGPNASGKTSILESISYALVKAYSKGNVDDLITNGEQKMEIQLGFHANGKNWSVKRNRVRERTANSILKEQRNEKYRLRLRGEQEVTQEIKNIIGLDKSLFLSSVYIRQGELLKLLEATASERKKIIGKLIGITEIESAWKNMRNIIDHFNQKKEKINIELREKNTPQKIKGKRQELEDLQKEIETLQNKKKKLEKTTEQVRKKFETLSQKRDRYLQVEQREKSLKKEKKTTENERTRIDITSDQLSQLEETISKKKQKKEQIKQDIKDLTSSLSSVREARSKKEELQINYLAERLEEITREINQLETDYRTDLQEEAKALKPTIDELNLPNVKKHIRKEKEKVEKKYRTLQDKINQQRIKIGELEGKQKQKQKLKETTKKAEQKCPVCGSKLSPQHKQQLIKKFENAIEKARRQINKNRKNLEKNKEKLGNIEEYRDRLQSMSIEMLEKQQQTLTEKNNQRKKWKKQLQSARKKLRQYISNKKIEIESLTDIHSKIVEIEEKRQKLQEHIEKLTNTVNELEQRKIEGEKRLERKHELDRELEDLEESLKQVRSEKETLGFNPAEYEQTKQKLETYEGKLNNWKGSLSEKQKKKAQQKEALNELQEELTEYREKKETLRFLNESFIPFLKKVRNTFHKDNLQKDLREYYRPKIEQEMKKTLAYLDLGFSDIELDEEWNIKVYGTRGTKNIDMISGGEKVGLAIALRLAISRVISGRGLELLMLDEPTIYLDDERVEKLAEIIRRLERIPQVIIVTHNEKLAECADVLYRVEKNRSGSEVTKASLESLSS